MPGTPWPGVMIHSVPWSYFVTLAQPARLAQPGPRPVGREDEVERPVHHPVGVAEEYAVGPHVAGDDLAADADLDRPRADEAVEAAEQHAAVDAVGPAARLEVGVAVADERPAVGVAGESLSIGAAWARTSSSSPRRRSTSCPERCSSTPAPTGRAGRGTRSA